jgi:hypothetical protein
MNKKYNWSDTLYVSKKENDCIGANYFLFRNINKLLENITWFIVAFSWENQFDAMVNCTIF